MKRVVFIMVLIALIVGLVFGGLSTANAAKPQPTPGTSLEVRVSNLETAVANLQSQQAAMSSQIANLTSQLQALQECVVCPPEPLFEDDFEDAAWTLDNWEVVFGDWQVAGGTYASASGRTLAGNVSWTDYTVSVDVMTENAANRCLQFRWLDSNSSYGVNLYGNPVHGVWLSKMAYGVDYSGIVHGYYSGDNGNWYTLKVQVIGNVIDIFVNDYLVIHYIDNGVDNGPVVPNGRIGLSAHGSQGQTVYFDNVKVIPE